MIYQSDFRTLPARFQPRYDSRRNFGNLRKSLVKINVISPSGKAVKSQSDDEEPTNYVQKWFLNFCDNTSVHGMKYIGQTGLHWSERFKPIATTMTRSIIAFLLNTFRAIWSLLVTSAVFGIIYISLQLSRKFSDSPLSTVVESTIFPVAEIAYPAVTICNMNRFHKERCEEAEKKFLPNANEETLELFRSLILSMNELEFGAFDEFQDEVFNVTSKTLESLNFTEVFEFVMLKCDEIFVGKCWWRNKYCKCCDDFFYLTRSEYGLCYSFNSAVTDVGKVKEVRRWCIQCGFFKCELFRRMLRFIIHSEPRTMEIGAG